MINFTPACSTTRTPSRGGVSSTRSFFPARGSDRCCRKRRIFSAAAESAPIRTRSKFYTRWNTTKPAREGGYGYLFGYPDYAVRFFVESSNEEKFSGRFVERDFRSIPTFARETNAFVYAVPKGQAENETDRALRARRAHSGQRQTPPRRIHRRRKARGRRNAPRLALQFTKNVFPGSAKIISLKPENA